MIFGTVCSKIPIFIGPDAVVFALTASYISFFVVNWKQIKQYSQNNNMIFCFLFIFIFMIVFMGIGVNTLFRVGGLINGFLLGIIFSRKLEDPSSSYSVSFEASQRSFVQKIKGWSKLTIGALVIFSLMNVICLILLFV